MNIADIKQIDIVDFLRVIGENPTKESGFSAWFHAPYRQDRTPSFKVNRKRNLWYDFGTGSSGDIIDLGVLIYGTRDIPTVIKKISDACPVSRLRTKHTVMDRPQEYVPVFKDIEVRSLASPALVSYLLSRSVDIDIGKRYCKEIHYSYKQSRYYALGFRNDSGGYEIRNPYFKGCIAPKGITLIRSDTPTRNCCVFEGFIDFLSCMTLAKNGRSELPEQDYDYLVMNSVSTLNAAVLALQGYKRLFCFMDNDDAGRRVVDYLREMNRWEISDMMSGHGLYKDVNDLLRGRKKLP